MPACTGSFPSTHYPFRYIWYTKSQKLTKDKQYRRQEPQPSGEASGAHPLRNSILWTPWGYGRDHWIITPVDANQKWHYMSAHIAHNWYTYNCAVLFWINCIDYLFRLQNISIIFLDQNGWNLFQGFPGYIHRKHNFFEYRQWNNLLLKSSNIPAKAGISTSVVFPYVPRCCVNIFLVHDFNSLNSSCFQDLFCHKSDTNLLTTNR